MDVPVNVASLFQQLENQMLSVACDDDDSYQSYELLSNVSCYIQDDWIDVITKWNNNILSITSKDGRSTLYIEELEEYDQINVVITYEQECKVGLQMDGGHPLVWKGGRGWTHSHGESNCTCNLITKDGIIETAFSILNAAQKSPKSLQSGRIVLLN